MVNENMLNVIYLHAACQRFQTLRLTKVFGFAQKVSPTNADAYLPGHMVQVFAEDISKGQGGQTAWKRRSFQSMH